MGYKTPTTVLELIRFWPLNSEEILWHLSTQVNGGLIASYINVFDPRRDKHMCFILFLVYAVIYPIIASNLEILATLSPWSDSVFMYTLYPLLRKPLLRRYSTVNTRLLINWKPALNILGYYQTH